MLLRALTLIFLGLTFSPFASATNAFELVSDETELIYVHLLALELFNNPKQMAQAFTNDMAELPRYGWQPRWSLQLKALDLIGYYAALEAAQYNASAGRWKAPAHPQMDAHLRFYQESINPKALPSSSGRSHQTIAIFAEQFLIKLMDRKSFQDRELIETLAQSGRKFWTNMIVWHVLNHPNADPEFIASLISRIQIEKHSRFGTSDYTEVVAAILKRGRKYSATDVEHLLEVLYAQFFVRSELDTANIHVRNLKSSDFGCDLVLAADARHGNAFNGKSIIVK